jgi:gliding motility-associated-like protein
MLRLTTIFCWTLTALLCPAQSTDGTWFFGSGGSIVFANGTVTTPGGALFTQEGCASLCEPDGDPIFFTNGEVVMDRNGNIMPNGTGLAGSFSSTQSAIIVPMLDGTDRYFIFTTPAMMGMFSLLPVTGLAYSVVDMTLNGGLGDVTDKNIVLFDNCTEKLTASRHANGRDVWVVVHEWDSDRYVAFLVSCEGVHGPVISPAGRSMAVNPGPDIVIPFYASLGAMDISPDGSTLAATWAKVEDGNIEGVSFLDILHFNDTTGVVSDWLEITHGGPGLDIRGYGMAFSPTGSKLYQTEFARLGFNDQGVIRQYDMTAADLPASEYIVTQDLPELGLVQAAPDRSMLVAILFGTDIAGITDPEQPGAACGFQPALVPLSVGSSMWGLPNDWDTGLRPTDPAEPLGLRDTTLFCSDTLYLELDVIANPFDAPTIAWSTGDTGPSVAITAPGTYSVTVRWSCDTLADALVVTGKSPLDPLGANIQGCRESGTKLDVTGLLSSVQWNTGDTGTTLLVTEPGSYVMTALDVDGCTVTDSLFVDLQNCQCVVHIPNTFTPNGDGINDVWQASKDCALISFDLTVFDRWGQVAFRTNDPYTPWPGGGTGEAPIDVYAYHLSYAFWDGLRNAQQERVGSVTIVR